MSRDISSAPAQPETGHEYSHSFSASTPSVAHASRSSPSTSGSNRIPPVPSIPSIPGTTGPVGEPALPPPRPSSNTNAMPSRISNSAGVANRRAAPSSSGSGRPNRKSDASPPRTAASRTHVPNIISSAFLKPMGTKRTRQDQNDANRPTSPPFPIARRPSQESGRRSHRHRNSNASIVTVEGQQRPLVDPDAPPLPTSRGTGASTVPPETQSDMARLGSMESGRSLAPLQNPRFPPPLQLATQNRTSSLQVQMSPKSPRSLRTSWGRQSRGRTEHSTTRDGHTKLASVPPSPAYAPDKVPATNDRADLGRNYQYYSGNAIFFLKGRLINTRQRPLNLLTALLAVLPAVFFFIFSAPWLWHNVSPAIPILFAYIFYICMSSFLHASFTEPGIIPRNLHPYPPSPMNEDPLAVGPPTTEWVTVRSFANSPDGSATAMEVPVKFCKSCNVWRPPRAHHCRVCDSCIETQDHHCVWLNNCVGRRNYRYFFTFVASGTILALFLLAASLAQILVWMVRNNSSFDHAINVWRVPFAMFIYSIVVLPYPASLLGYHMFLTGRGETTREYLNSHKFQEKDRHRPFSQHSILKNWATVLMRARPPTYMRFKSRYERGDRRIGETTRVKRSEKQQEKEGGLEMNQINNSSRGSSRGFQGPNGRGPINNINNAPRDDGNGAGSPML